MTSTNLYSFLPKVDELLENKKIEEVLISIPRSIVLDSIRREIEIIRDEIKHESLDKKDLLIKIDHIVSKAIKRAKLEDSYKLKKVINASGIIIHTNLGRSLLGDKVLEHIVEIAGSYSNLEFDIKSGERGSRYSIVEDIVCRITGAESALVVNNNAAALLLALSSLAKNKEVIVSRGELIEIGGSFRIPDVMKESGASLVEVGTTNKTHLRDYEKAITENTGALLKVHTSNYRILGFTSSVLASELVEVKKKYNLPIIEDLGSGVLIDLSKYGLDYEPTVQESLLNGVDIVTFSGDKLLGGPQAGIIVGKEEYVSLMKENPLTRAFRVDKFTLAALEATLRYYLDEKTAISQIPTLNMLTRSMHDIEKGAIELLEIIEDNIPNNPLSIAIEDSYSQVGGGSLPLTKLATKCIVLSSNNHSIELIEKLLRSFYTPIISRIFKDRIYFDLRTIKRDEYEELAQGIKHIVTLLQS